MLKWDMTADPSAYTINSEFVYVKSWNSVWLRDLTTSLSMGVRVGFSLVNSSSKLLKSRLDLYNTRQNERKKERKGVKKGNSSVVEVMRGFLNCVQIIIRWLVTSEDLIGKLVTTIGIFSGFSAGLLPRRSSSRSLWSGPHFHVVYYTHAILIGRHDRQCEKEIKYNIYMLVFKV